MQKTPDHIRKKEKALEIALPFLGTALSLGLLTVLLELFFHASKASFLSQLDLLSQITVMANSLFLLLVPILAIGLILYLFSIVFFRMEKTLRVIYHTYFFLLALWLLIILVSHMDTFAYTTFHTNIFLFPYFINLLLVFLILLISIVLSARKAQGFSAFILARRRSFSIIIGILCIASVIPFSLILKRTHVSLPGTVSEEELALDESTENRPNIIIFSADGLDRQRLGVYGYERETTPNLSRFENAIVYTRAYPNCGNSRGSIISILTGKNPISTKLIFPPDILHGKDALQHLPHILTRLGYYNVDINDGYFGSPQKSNLRCGFHLENGYETRLSDDSDFRNRFLSSITDETYFLSSLLERHLSKLIFMATSSVRSYHSFHDRFSEKLFSFDKFMEFGEGTGLSDRKRIDMLKEIIRKADQPLFAHIHLMTTHAPALEPPYRKFSIGERHEQLVSRQRAAEEQQRLKNMWENDRNEYERNIYDRYDDAILSVDHFFGEVIQTLMDTGKMERTLLIFLTDHGSRTHENDYERVLYPLPLIVYLPGQEKRMVVDNPVQYLDITSSILRLISQPIPEWMDGNIIFEEPMDQLHFSSAPQMGVMTTSSKKNYGARHLKTEFGPPCYGIDVFRLVANEKVYLYIRDSNSGRLFDASDDPFALEQAQDQRLLNEYHNLLCELLEKEGIRITREPQHSY